MVKGLELFKEHFRDYTDRYVIIGGTACDLAMNQASIEFRATKDLDIVLCIETFDAIFAKQFWEFIHAGKYQTKELSSGKKQYYRFMHPDNGEYPFKLELFSRVPDAITLKTGSHLTPLPTEEDVSSLSAILMDDNYYRFILAGKKQFEDISVVGPEHLIPLKAKAWIDLKNRKESGENIDSRNITKHKNDVFRLFRILNPDFTENVPDSIKADLMNFLSRVQLEEIDLKTLGLGKTTLDYVLNQIRKIYQIK
jgi:hypothetical protein